MENTMIIY